MDPLIQLKAIAEMIEGVSTQILDYALVLAAVGTITMALLQLLKSIIRARMFFHRNIVSRWINRVAAQDKIIKAEKVLEELLRLAVGGKDYANALYDQRTAKMLGMIQAATNVAMDFPGVYPALYAFLTTGERADQTAWSNFCKRMTPPGAARKPGTAATQQATQARARLGNLVARRLDAFQTRAEYWWSRLNQLAAVTAGGGFLVYILTVRGVTDRPTVIVVAVFGGLVAPFAKDVVSALSGLRARRGV